MNNVENPIIDSNNTTVVRNTSLAAQAPVDDDLKTSFAGVAGNILEWYDFAIFGYFSDIIADNFFAPSQEGNASLLETFAVFGLAFLARPFGGAVIGRMGDMHGRKGALETSIFLMAGSTFLMGCLPNYSLVGGFSTVLLILLRLFQGLSVGGQLMSSLVFTVERKPAGTWGFWGSVVSAASSVGVTLGSLAATVLRESLTEEQLETWGWRIPFWFGALGAVPALYLKLQAIEHPVPPSRQSSSATNETADTLASQGVLQNIDEKKDPLRVALSKTNRRAFIAAILIPTMGAAAYYIVFVWFARFMDSLVDPPIPHAFAITSYNGLLAGIVFTIFGGWFADWVGDYAKVMIVSGVLLAVSFPVCLHFIGTGFGSDNEYTGVVAFLIQLYLGIVLAVWSGAQAPWMVLIFPPEIRLTSIAIGYNICLAIWGGFSPLLATVLVEQISNSAPGYLIIATFVLSHIALCIAPKEGQNMNAVEWERKEARLVSIGDGKDGYEPLLT